MTGFGALVRQARAAQGITQAELARRLGVDRAYVCRIELVGGRAAVTSASLIARLLLALKVPAPALEFYLLALAADAVEAPEGRVAA